MLYLAVGVHNAILHIVIKNINVMNTACRLSFASQLIVSNNARNASKYDVSTSGTKVSIVASILFSMVAGVY